MGKIIKNIAICKLCGDIIESGYRRDFVLCSCRATGVDGGHDYQRVIGEPEDYDLSMSEYTEEN